MKRHTLATAMLALLLCLATACGSEDGGGVEASTDDKAAIQTLFADYNSALDSGEFADVCAMNTQQFNDELVGGFREAGGDPTAKCPKALKVMSYRNRPTELTLDNIEISANTATGDVGPSTWRFTRVDGVWQVAHAN